MWVNLFWKSKTWACIVHFDANPTYTFVFVVGRVSYRPPTPDMLPKLWPWMQKQKPQGQEPFDGVVWQLSLMAVNTAGMYLRPLKTAVVSPTFCYVKCKREMPGFTSCIKPNTEQSGDFCSNGSFHCFRIQCLHHIPNTLG